MKLVTFSKDNAISCGILTDRGIIDIPAAWQQRKAPHSVKEILKRGRPCLEKLAELAQSTQIITPQEYVKLLAPIPRPPKVLALAGNYSEHIQEMAFCRWGRPSS